MFNDNFIVCLIILLAFVCGCIYGSKKQSKVAVWLTIEALAKTLKDTYSDEKDIECFMKKFIDYSLKLSNIKHYI